MPAQDDQLIAPFWHWAAKGEIRLPRRADGSFDWYPSDPQALWIPLPGTATLFSWAVIHRPLHPGYADISPYISAIVELDGAPGVRLVTRLIDAPEHLEIGMKLVARFEDLTYPKQESGVIAPLFAVARG